MTPIATPRPATGSGLELMMSSLTVPYAAGMSLDTVPLKAGAFTVATPRREPVLLVRLRRALADEAVVVHGQIAGRRLTPVVFAPFSHEGSILPIYRPELTADSDGAGPFAVEATVHLVDDERRHNARPATGAALAAAAAEALIEGAVLDGRFARMLLLSTLEKQRAIRVMREIAAMRHLELAALGALDARGRSLGVPRRVAPRESDEHYRARLAMYSAWRLATPAGFELALNGPGVAGEPNRGLPARAGVTERFRVIEQINALSVATKLIAVGPDGAVTLERFQRLLRTVYLFNLDRPAAETLPRARRERAERIRATLRSELTRASVAETRWFSPLVASTLDRAVRLMRALGHRDDITLLRAHEPTGGSRYELGLGIDIAPLKPEHLRDMAGKINDVAANGGELGQLASSLIPRALDDDPLGRWLLGPCGFRTVHQLPDDSVHLSPLPSLGQWIEGPGALAVEDVALYDARYHSSGSSTEIHVRAAESADNVSGVFAAAGLPPAPAALTPAALRTSLTEISEAAPAPPPESLAAAVADGVVAAEGAVLAEYLLRVFNLDQIVAYPVSSAQLTALGSPNLIRDHLLAWAEGFRDAGFYTVRSLWDEHADQLLMLCSVSQLPGAAPRIGEPPSATYYWYQTRLPGPIPGTDDPLRILQSRGGRAKVSAAGAGLALLVSIGYARRGLADPFEIRIELDNPAAMLTADQYGYLMNLLDFVYPIGIEINTFDIRRNHVDIDGDGKPGFLTSRASRTYYQDRHRRPFGARERRNTTGGPQ